MKDVSCVDHLNSVNLVTNVPIVAPDLPVGARLHQFWEKWAALGASPKVVTVLREGYTLPFWFRPDLTCSPVIGCYVNPHRNLYLLEALHQILNKNTVVEKLQDYPCSRIILITPGWPSNQVDFRAPPLKAIADFLMYLFQDRKLQPGTIVV